MVCWGMATTVSLPEADYTDTFASRATRSTPPRRGRGRRSSRARAGTSTPSSWSGAAAAAAARPFEAPDNVAGWHIVENTDRRLVLGAESWHLIARLVFESEESGLG